MHCTVRSLPRFDCFTQFLERQVKFLVLTPELICCLTVQDENARICDNSINRYSARSRDHLRLAGIATKGKGTAGMPESSTVTP